MKYNTEKPHRRSVRMGGFDYSSCGVYFVTVCVHERMDLFGEIKNSSMILNDYGKIVEEEWVRSAEIRKEISLDEYVVMPNHFHGILFINDYSHTNRCRGEAVPRPSERATHRVAPTLKPGSLGSIIGQFKSITTKRINKLRNMSAIPVWQRNYYEHIIRNDDEMYEIQTYIQNNAKQWELDEENPDKRKKTEAGTACRARTESRCQ